MQKKNTSIIFKMSRYLINIVKLDLLLVIIRHLFSNFHGKKSFWRNYDVCYFDFDSSFKMGTLSKEYLIHEWKIFVIVRSRKIAYIKYNMKYFQKYFNLFYRYVINRTVYFLHFFSSSNCRENVVSFWIFYWFFVQYEDDFNCNDQFFFIDWQER